MRLIDIINGAWATTPQMLGEIQGIYTRHMRGDKLDLASLEAKIGAPLNSEPKGYTVQDGVAVLPIDGVISKRMNLFTKISGGTSTQLLERDFRQAIEDRDVEAIVLAIDSPGGTVDGTPELAKAIFDARGDKPVLAITDGMMASAAYWIGSAADLVNISSDVSMVGSIGVVAKHVDTSKREETAGIKTTEIVAGKYKRISSNHGPLTEEGREDLQAFVDHVYSVFVNDVAKQRGVSADTVLETMADGQIFHGRQSIENGLADGVATLAETIEQARDLARAGNQTASRAGVAGRNSEVTVMNLQEFKVENPEIADQLIAEARAGFVAESEVATALITGAENERQRIADVRDQSVAGHESLIETLAFDGKSTGADAALAIVAAEQKKGNNALADMDADANEVVPSADADAGSVNTIKRSEFNALDQAGRREFIDGDGKIVD